MFTFTCANGFFFFFYVFGFRPTRRTVALRPDEKKKQTAVVKAYLICTRTHDDRVSRGRKKCPDKTHYARNNQRVGWKYVTGRETLGEESGAGRLASPGLWSLSVDEMVRQIRAIHTRVSTGIFFTLGSSENVTTASRKLRPEFVFDSRRAHLSSAADVTLVVFLNTLNSLLTTRPRPHRARPSVKAGLKYIARLDKHIFRKIPLINRPDSVSETNIMTIDHYWPYETVWLCIIFSFEKISPINDLLVLIILPHDFATALGRPCISFTHQLWSYLGGGCPIIIKRD